MPDFRFRSTAQEVMDDLESAGYALEQSLRELAVINKWLGGHRVLQSALKQLKPYLVAFERPIKIADLGCGGGDLLAFVKEWGEAHSLPFELYGYDANPHVIKFANDWIADPAIHFETANVFDNGFQQTEFDVVLLTLFCHHLPDEALVSFLSRLKSQTSTAIIINDLHRHPLAYHSIHWLTWLFSKTPMVKADAPQSVLRAFTREELYQMLQAAGFANFALRWQWAFRWQAIAYP